MNEEKWSNKSCNLAKTTRTKGETYTEKRFSD